MDHYIEEWLYYNFAAGSFHTLCSSLYSIEIEFCFLKSLFEHIFCNCPNFLWLFPDHFPFSKSLTVLGLPGGLVMRTINWHQTDKTSYLSICGMPVKLTCKIRTHRPIDCICTNRHFISYNHLTMWSFSGTVFQPMAQMLLTKCISVNEQVMWLVITEVRSEGFGLVTECLHCNTHHIFDCRVWYHVLSLRYACIRSSGIVLIP